MFNGDKQNKAAKRMITHTYKIAVFMLAVSVIGIFYLAYKLMACDNAEKVFNTLLPVVTTWVGTILAFYFTKDNFESASTEMQNMFDKLSPKDKKLASILAGSQMMDLRDDEFVYIKMTAEGESKITIKMLIEKLNNYSRLPVVNDMGYPKYIIHRSTLYEFIANEMMGGKTADEVNAMTLDRVLGQSPELKRLFESTFITITSETSLYEANTKMNAKPGCQDILVTENGTKSAPLVGWITNVILLKNAKI